MIEEMLSKTDDPKTPVEELEYYELSLLDEVNDLGTRHVVKQWHGAWSEIDRQIMWDGEEVEYFWILDQAKQRYEESSASPIPSSEQGWLFHNSAAFLRWPLRIALD